MKKSIALWQFVGFALTSFVGTLLHFLYDWSEKSSLAAIFSGVNESTWEHMKLFFWPAFLFAVGQSFFFREDSRFWCIKLRGILLGLALIPILFYGYNGIIGKSPDFVNIAIFFASAAFSFFYEAKTLHSDQTRCKAPKIAFAALCVIALFFIIFTFQTPKIELFRDPITQSFGI